MKKILFLPSILFILAIMTLGLTSCSKKYGCYYSQTQELKFRSDMESCVDVTKDKTLLVSAFNTIEACPSMDAN